MPIHRYSEEEAREAGLLDVIEVQPRPRRALLRAPAGGAGGSSGRAASGAAPAVRAAPGGRARPDEMPSPGPGRACSTGCVN